MTDSEQVFPQITARTPVAKSRLFQIESVDLIFANGRQVTYERLISSGSGGAVLVVPLLDADTVLLIREYAVGMERYELALPKGKIEVGEDLLTAANRELMEEVGYGARSLKHLKTFSVAPGYMAHRTHIVLAEDLYPQRLPGDEPEPLAVVPWKLSNLSALWQQEECSEARSIAALCLVRDGYGR
jgi:ADP-ribose diphosphatase